MNKLVRVTDTHLTQFDGLFSCLTSDNHLQALDEP
jgi:hypothetical protein